MDFGTLTNLFSIWVGADPFLFWLFFIGIIIASLQDLKRREVDDWLNLFLLVTSFIFVFYKAIFERDATIIFQAGFALVIMFAFMNVFYYGRIFAGGDAKLLVAMTVFFVGADFNMTLINIGIFLLFLMFSGSVYGMIYSFVLYSKNFKKVNKEIGLGVRSWGLGGNGKRGRPTFYGLKPKTYVWYWMLGIGILILFSYVNWFFLGLAVFMFLLPVLYVFAKALENISMVKNISGKDLREGDWLVEDVRVKGRIIKADWDGLSSENIKLLKNKKKVKIKEGLPFVPAFLIAFLLYVFLRGWLILIFIG